MNQVDKSIVEFISDHHVLSLATCEDGKPWVASCFYVYNQEENVFLITTDKETKHGNQALVNSDVAINIVLETEKIGMIRGLQVSASITCIEASIFSKYKRMYLKRFPYAVLKQSDLWIIKPNLMKLTDNRLGFGKKLIWSN
ncbi:pyridoxamine 5'-phosphate oxidase family protein [Prolixibacteraceae bacterium]|nr:pyridoxamine 5'-phosphate oxidase family protein [Prolixibacteraceae bacterium]